MKPVQPDAAAELAAELDLDVDDIAICHACLSFVAFAVDGGDERDIRRETNRMTPQLWAEGLALPARLALERARERNVRNADRAIADVAERGPRSPVAKAIVRRLGADLMERSKGNLLKMGFEPWPPAELRGGGAIDDALPT
jgi:hypothetical protein